MHCSPLGLHCFQQYVWEGANWLFNFEEMHIWTFFYSLETIVKAYRKTLSAIYTVDRKCVNPCSIMYNSKIRTIWWIWIPSFLTGYRSFDSICSSFYILPFPFKVLCLLRRFFLSKIIFVDQKGAAEPQHCLKICECELGLWFLIYWIYWWTYSLYSIYVHNGSRRVDYWQVDCTTQLLCIMLYRQNIHILISPSSPDIQ